MNYFSFEDFDSSNKRRLHEIKVLKIGLDSYRLCYFRLDESIFCPNYRRSFVLLPPQPINHDDSYPLSFLTDYVISFSLARYLYGSSEV